jgi:transcription antitermination factor NusG
MSITPQLEQGATERATSWCALYARHQHERNVATLLSSKGFQVFLPTYVTVHRWSDRKKQVTLPLFPGYVFFVDQAERRLQILSTPGVHTILTLGKAPALIPEDQIEAIRRAVNSPFRVSPHPFLKSGDAVRIKSGPLVGIEGIVSREKDIFRVVISVEMLGRSAAVEIDASAVERIHTRIERISSQSTTIAVRPRQIAVA